MLTRIRRTSALRRLYTKLRCSTGRASPPRPVKHRTPLIICPSWNLKITLDTKHTIMVLIIVVVKPGPPRLPHSVGIQRERCHLHFREDKGDLGAINSRVVLRLVTALWFFPTEEIYPVGYTYSSIYNSAGFSGSRGPVLCYQLQYCSSAHSRAEPTIIYSTLHSAVPYS